MSKRIVFTFDDRSYSGLRDLQKIGRFNSLADAVRESIALKLSLEKQAHDGFDTVIVRNSKGRERVMRTI